MRVCSFAIAEAASLPRHNVAFVLFKVIHKFCFDAIRHFDNHTNGKMGIEKVVEKVMSDGFHC